VNQEHAEKIAAALVQGFVKCGTMNIALYIAGIKGVHSDEEALELHAQFPFLPGCKWTYAGKYGTPIRAFIAAEWPKLADYIDAHSNDEAKLAKLPSQIIKLTCKDKQRERLSKEDKAVAARNHRTIVKSEAGIEAARRQRESQSGAAWKTCKGPVRARRLR
jgi:hypothetical protein